MNIHKIAVIPGDGIGKEVIAEGVKLLEAIAERDGGFKFEFTHFPYGCEYYKETGKMMAEDGIEQLKKHDAIFLGAVGAPGVPDHISLWAPNPVRSSNGTTACRCSGTCSRRTSTASCSTSSAA